MTLHPLKPQFLKFKLKTATLLTSIDLETARETFNGDFLTKKCLLFTKKDNFNLYF